MRLPEEPGVAETFAAMLLPAADDGEGGSGPKEEELDLDAMLAGGDDIVLPPTPTAAQRSPIGTPEMVPPQLHCHVSYALRTAMPIQ